MDKKPKSRIHWLLWALIVTGVLVVGTFLATTFGLLPATGIHCWKMQIDLNTGRIRAVRFVFWYPVSTRFEETVLSEITSAGQALPAPPVWVTAATVGPDVTPSTRFVSTGALSQMADLSRVFKAGNFTAAAKSAIAAHFLQHWKQLGLGRGTGVELEKLGKLSVEKSGPIDEPEVTELLNRNDRNDRTIPEPGLADLPVGLEARQRVPAGFMAPIRDLGIAVGTHRPHSLACWTVGAGLHPLLVVSGAAA